MPTTHWMSADHLTAETGIRYTARGKTVVKWKLKSRRYNYRLDVLVGNAMCASMAGYELAATMTPRKKAERRKLRARQLV